MQCAWYCGSTLVFRSYVWPLTNFTDYIITDEQITVHYSAVRSAAAGLQTQ